MSRTRAARRTSRRSQRILQTVIAVLLLIVTASVVGRLVTDVPHLVAGTMPADSFDRGYVSHPWSTWLHIAPGALYLLLAPLQLAGGFRSRHRTLHRRLGRVLASAGLVSGVLALVIGAWFPFGGALETAATAVFGTWFLACLVIGVRAVRRGHVPAHRRWMVRAFAAALGIATVRLWLVIFQVAGLDFASSLGPAFVVAFSLHVVAGELWLRAGPARPARTVTAGGDPLGRRDPLAAPRR